MKLAEVMSAPVLVVPGRMPAHECADLMEEHGLRHLPVVSEDGRCTGMLTDYSLKRRSMRADVGLGDLTAAQLQRDVQVLLDETTPLDQALVRLHGTTQDAIVVIRIDMRPVGIFTEHDAMALAARELPNRPLVPSHAALPVLEASTSAVEARSWMARERLLHAMLVRDHRLVGVLSFRDVALEDDLEEHVLACDVASRPIASRERLAARKVASLLHTRKVGCLPVVDSEWRPIDITTRRDIMSALVPAVARS